MPHCHSVTVVATVSLRCPLFFTSHAAKDHILVLSQPIASVVDATRYHVHGVPVARPRHHQTTLVARPSRRPTNRLLVVARLGTQYAVDMASRAIDYQRDWLRKQEDTIFEGMTREEKRTAEGGGSSYHTI